MFQFRFSGDDGKEKHVGKRLFWASIEPVQMYRLENRGVNSSGLRPTVINEVHIYPHFSIPRPQTSLSLANPSKRHKQTKNKRQLSKKMTESPVRFGIMGCAEIARKLARAIDLAPNAILYAIASRSLEKAKQFAASNALNESVKIYASYQELLADPSVDVVYMPLPTSLHLEWAVKAALKGKHLLLEKPVALSVYELDKILEACQSSGVQFMDGSMWLHHPRTARMMELISGSNNLVGSLDIILSTSTFLAPPEFHENDIRVKPDMDGLGALGDLGWYSIGAVLWAKSYQLPDVVTALPDMTKNQNGVILSCSASLHYKNSTSAIIQCSFLCHKSMDLTIVGRMGSLHLRDFTIPYQENSAFFDLTTGANFVDMHIGWSARPQRIMVVNELPQEAVMVENLARIVGGIKQAQCEPDRRWSEISRRTQVVVDAVMKSIDTGCRPVYL